MIDYDILWNTEEPVARFGIEVPEWIDEDITVAGVAAIVSDGCASGAYMPAVLYNTARATMDNYGDEVLDFIKESMGELPGPQQGTSWSQIAVFYLSLAVELWANEVIDELTQAVTATNKQ